MIHLIYVYIARQLNPIQLSEEENRHTTVKPYKNKIIDGCRRYKSNLFELAIVLMTLTAIGWLGYEFWRLLWQPDPLGPIDLKQRHLEVRYWFNGNPVYESLPTAVYPPASYVLLWPLLGWLEGAAVRWLWAATTVAALAGLICLLVRESRASTLPERTFVALIPLSMYATGATIGNGQLGVHILPLLITALLMLRYAPSWKRDLLAAALFLACLVKPSFTAPFFWIVLLVPARLRPALLVLIGYLSLTLLAALFQEASTFSLVHSWARNAITGTTWGTEHGSTSSTQSWLSALALERISLPVTLLILFIAGAWVYYHRHAELWLLLGCVAIIARFWTYHLWYDDLLLLLPMVALFRLAKDGTPHQGRRRAKILLAITLLTLLAPGGLYLLPSPWNALYVAIQTLVWIGVLVFLAYQAWHTHRTTTT